MKEIFEKREVPETIQDVIFNSYIQKKEDIFIEGDFLLLHANLDYFLEKKERDFEYHSVEVEEIMDESISMGYLIRENLILEPNRLFSLMIPDREGEDVFINLYRDDNFYYYLEFTYIEDHTYSVFRFKV